MYLILKNIFLPLSRAVCIAILQTNAVVAEQKQRAERVSDWRSVSFALEEMSSRCSCLYVLCSDVSVCQSVCTVELRTGAVSPLPLCLLCERSLLLLCRVSPLSTNVHCSCTRRVNAQWDFRETIYSVRSYIQYSTICTRSRTLLYSTELVRVAHSPRQQWRA